ncbi:MAG TPA: response regulator [Bacteroidota bacterium]|nr:response regulator [Bacteroidota bacterium]
MKPEHKPILLVDDSETDVFLMQRAFQKAGVMYPLVIVRNGEEAIAYLQGERMYANREQFPLPIAMLLDLKMPNIDGFEVIKWVRTQPILKRLIIIAQTSSPRIEDINLVYDLGANGFLTKPGSIDELVEMAATLSAWLQINQVSEIAEVEA